MVTMYGISNCDTIRKAKKWLQENNIDFQFHDFRKDGVDRALLEQWVDTFGWEKLLNKRGLTWRKLDDSQKADIDRDKAIEIMLEHPAIIKRPVLDAGTDLLLGFDEAKWRDALAADD